MIVINIQLISDLEKKGIYLILLRVLDGDSYDFYSELSRNQSFKARMKHCLDWNGRDTKYDRCGDVRVLTVSAAQLNAFEERQTLFERTSS